MKSYCTTTLVLSLVTFCMHHSLLFGRVGETPEQIAQRYGPPLTETHAVFSAKNAAALLKLRQDQGLPLMMRFYEAQLALASSPFRERALGALAQIEANMHTNTNEGLDRKIQFYEAQLAPASSPLKNEASARLFILKAAKTGNVVALTERAIVNKEMVRIMTPKVYCFNDTLIQVIFLEGRNGPFSYSESYFKILKSNNGEYSLQPIPADLLETLVKKMRAEANSVPPVISLFVNPSAEVAATRAELNALSLSIASARRELDNAGVDTGDAAAEKLRSLIQRQKALQASDTNPSSYADRICFCSSEDCSRIWLTTVTVKKFTQNQLAEIIYFDYLEFHSYDLLSGIRTAINAIQETLLQVEAEAKAAKGF